MSKSSNSKLTDSQNASRKAMKKGILAAGGSIARYGRVTVVTVPEFTRSRMQRVSVAWASPDEKKLRVKVGEYHALVRMGCDQAVLVPSDFSAQMLAEIFADCDEAGASW